MGTINDCINKIVRRSEDVETLPEFVELLEKIKKEIEENFLPKVTEPEAVHHPPHYVAGGIEVIDFIEAWNLGYKEGNVIKYVARAKHKGREVEDLKKARWYLDRTIEKLEGE